MRYLLFLSLFNSLLFMANISAADDNAEKFLVFKALPDDDQNSDCNQRGGLRVFIFNEHPSSPIDIQLDRYFSDVRQAGRSMFALQHGHSQALGCNIVMNAEQRWELVNAEFISKEDAIEHYGKLY